MIFGHIFILVISVDLKINKHIQSAITINVRRVSLLNISYLAFKMIKIDPFEKGPKNGLFVDLMIFYW